MDICSILEQDDTDDSDYKIEDEGRRKQLVNRMAQPPTPVTNLELFSNFDFRQLFSFGYTEVVQIAVRYLTF